MSKLLVLKANRTVIYILFLTFIILSSIGFYVGWQNMEFNQNSVAGLTAKGVVAYRQLALDEAIITWKEAIKLQPDQPQLRYYLAQALESTGAVKGAISEYQQVLQLDPKLVTPRYNLAGLYLEQGEVDKAEKLLTEAVKVAPYFTAGRLQLAEIFQQQENSQLALDEYQAVIDLAENSTFELSEVYFEMGNIYLTMGMPDKALRAWQKTLELQPDHGKAKESVTKLQRIQ